ncbi:hypothetical protein JCM21531_2377 [Acetivibrio straminisolvens JCM 21531]|uniref:Uncharacterized protein n=1 Tax=Acetivibrio straminisolvens JCM 21531 TaxID=1294263 RepID=W4V662_9FIRM|nr:hypothetical protein JCM21531_2377 [Acetivibrio straminisolvens JCM 21531]
MDERLYLRVTTNIPITYGLLSLYIDINVPIKLRNNGSVPLKPTKMGKKLHPFNSRTPRLPSATRYLRETFSRRFPLSIKPLLLTPPVHCF